MSKTPSYANAQSVDQDLIPVIHLSGRDHIETRRDLAQQLVATAENSGFFYISHHGIPKAVCEAAFKASRQFFALDHAVKSKITVDQNQRGWMAQGLTNLEGSATHDAKEVFFWGFDIDKDDAALNGRKTTRRF